jgi:hypothetical protein
MSSDRIQRQVAHSIARGDLSQDANNETAADRIGALARSDPLGSALLRVLWQHDVSSLRDVFSLLAQRLVDKGKMEAGSPLLMPLVRQAVEEWCVCQCAKCGGHKFTPSPEGVRAVCDECAGTGKGTHTPEERMRALHIGYREYAHVVAVFAYAATLLSAADNRVARQVSKQLERK